MEPPNVGDIIRTSALASAEFENIFRQKYKKGLEEIGKSSHDVFFLHLHSCFWKKGVGISLMDELASQIKASKNFKAKCVVTLIDDFFNVYFRIRDLYQRKGVGEIFSPLDILYWRSMEIMLARMLANWLGAPHHIVSINHPAYLLERLLFEEHLEIYAGHPISEIRKQTNLTKKSQLTDRINNEFLKPLFQEKDFVVFIPDTIDERPLLELVKEKGPNVRLEELQSLIWPRIWLDSAHPGIGKTPDEGLARKYFRDLCDFIAKNQEALYDVVNGQISDRDYRLVNQTQDFVFMLTTETSNSDGVKAELSHAKSLFRHTHFLNPDKLSLSASTGGPNWASGVAVQHDNAEHLIKALKEHDFRDPYLV